MPNLALDSKEFLHGIIARLRAVLEFQKETNVYDKDVAKALGIPASTLATCKKRGSIPYDEILMFCAKNNVSTNWLFFQSGAIEYQYDRSA